MAQVYFTLPSSWGGVLGCFVRVWLVLKKMAVDFPDLFLVLRLSCYCFALLRFFPRSILSRVGSRDPPETMFQGYL